MNITSEPKRISMEESVKRTIPFDWGFGSTPRTK